MADSDESTPPPNPSLQRQESLAQVEELQSVWGTLKDKPTTKDLSYTDKESDLYKGQSLSTRGEILGWYLYDWAHSPMFNVGQGLVLPLLISGLALQYGCESVTKYGCDVNDDPINEDGSVVVFMGNWALKPAAFVQICTSFSGAMQAVAYISIGALADYSHYQYYMFRICTVIASVMPLALFFCGDPSTYLFAGWWYAIQLVFFGLALIFYNAYLPPIVENHWIVRREIRGKKPTEEICIVKQQITDDMSQYGVACGYLGSLIMTLVTTVVLYGTETTEYEQLTGYGLNEGTSFNEEWLKAVETIQMRFDTTGLTQVQLLYKDMEIDGDIYGDINSAEPLLTYTVTDKDYVSQIQFWLNTDDSINAMRFMTQKDVFSQIYGTNTTATPYQIAVSTENIPKDFIFAGYIVYVDSNDYVTGMDITMLNTDTGQFQSTIGMRLSMLLVFIWWNFFQLFVFKYLKRRDGPPLPSDAKPLTFSTLQFWRAIRSAKKFPNMFRYLLAWFCFSDGLNTLSVTAVLFATTEMGVSTFEGALLVLEALFLGSWGGVFFLWLQRKIGWDAKRMLLLHIGMFIGLCLYTIIGLIPNAPFGLVSTWELYLYGFVFGTNWGSIQSYARSVFAYLVPIGQESQMFSLYEITDKGSSWIGPLMVALITNHASIRWGMFYVTVFFLVAAPLLIWGVDLKVGMIEAGRWTESDSSGADLIRESKEQMKYKETEMIDKENSNTDTAPTIDNYNEPNMKIKVTSLDDEEEEAEAKRKETAESENEMIDKEENVNHVSAVPSNSAYDDT